MNHSRILPEEALNKSQASKFTAMLLIGRNVGLAVSFFRSNSPPDLLFFSASSSRIFASSNCLSSLPLQFY
ncbi:hypothetical protein [Nitrosospira multiformis]|uniref:hypothetical protein n=1 Tax=Nitrosospira multiformis TaxID=1231 RepID=UPI0009458D23|nr:hypothetical protein [Nitrosospira multiformis]